MDEQKYSEQYRNYRLPRKLSNRQETADYVFVGLLINSYLVIYWHSTDILFIHTYTFAKLRFLSYQPKNQTDKILHTFKKWELTATTIFMMVPSANGFFLVIVHVIFD